MAQVGIACAGYSQVRVQVAIFGTHDLLLPMTQQHIDTSHPTSSPPTCLVQCHKPTGQQEQQQQRLEGGPLSHSLKMLVFYIINY